MAEEHLLREAFSLVRHNRHRKLKAFLKSHEADLDVDTRDEKGNTMLCVACQNGLKRMAKIVLKNGADMNVQNNLGNTPLHFCFQRRRGRRRPLLPQPHPQSVCPRLRTRLRGESQPRRAPPTWNW